MSSEQNSDMRLSDYLRAAITLFLVITLIGCSSTPSTSLSTDSAREKREGSQRGSQSESTQAPPSSLPTDLQQELLDECEPERPREGNPPFYQVNGHRYHVQESSFGHVEEGIASWYGEQFHGRPTANGERYNMHALTAAHPSLPIPSTVLVENLANGRQVTVRINDRGPFAKGRVIDLSYAAAQSLDMVREGTAPVRIRALEPCPQPSSSDREHYLLQLGAFGERRNAEQLLQGLSNAGLGPVAIHYDPKESRPLYRVRIGPLSSVERTESMVDRLADAGITDYRLITESVAEESR